mgnify:CR=1 FL=1
MRQQEIPRLRVTLGKTRKKTRIKLAKSVLSQFCMVLSWFYRVLQGKLGDMGQNGKRGPGRPLGDQLLVGRCQMIVPAEISL